MPDHVEMMFEGMSVLIKRLKKASYEKNMKMFRERNRAAFREMTAYVDAAENKDAAAKQLAQSFTGRVREIFQVKGKIKSYTQADMNLFMVLYVFPAILLTNHPEAKRIAGAIRDAWRDTFKNSNIDYRDYDTIYNSFNEKIMGLF